MIALGKYFLHRRVPPIVQVRSGSPAFDQRRRIPRVAAVNIGHEYSTSCIFKSV